MEITNKTLNISKERNIVRLKKRDMLQREGEITTKAFYVKKGLLRSYTIDDNGKEHIFMFAPREWVIADLESQEFNRPTKLFIDCIEDSEVIILDRNTGIKTELNVDNLKIRINLLSRRIAVLQRRVLLLMSSNARERYELFLETYPNIVKRVPQRMIASYLGVTPQALSCIRGKIKKMPKN